ncbi:MAG: hypothetical protein HY910_13085 [Desulfarculus sp.]|nr:hypothetical protein [Desulfarculus sp.]
MAHNRQAKIIWGHAGWDNTGLRGAALCRQLLDAHPSRLILGSDHFFLAPGDLRQLPQRAPGMARLLRLLPPDLAEQVGCGNPRRIFGLGE